MSLTPLVSVPLLPEAVGNTLLLLGSFLLLLLGAEVFTNGVEWLGHKLGVSESATGSILAAVGTALPETMIPVIAIVGAMLGTNTQAAADEVGVGAILGAPFMLATIAMFLVGVSVLYFSDRRAYGDEFHFDAESTRRDLLFFLAGYTIAFLAALIPRDLSVSGVQVGSHVSLGIGALLLVMYVVYVYRSLQSGELVENESLDDLHTGALLDRATGGNPTSRASDPPRWLVALQTLLALALIVGGAHLFVTEIEWAGSAVGIPNAVLALLLAPLATELPEKFNSVLWISRDKDTLAIGNITGAMAFQGTLPVTLGIVFTSWNITLEWGTTGFLNGLSAILAIASGGLLYLRARSVEEGTMRPGPFLLGGILYALFIVVLVYHVVAYDLSVAPGH